MNSVGIMHGAEIMFHIGIHKNIPVITILTMIVIGVETPTLLNRDISLIGEFRIRVR